MNQYRRDKKAIKVRKRIDTDEILFKNLSKEVYWPLQK